MISWRLKILYRCVHKPWVLSFSNFLIEEHVAVRQIYILHCLSESYSKGFLRVIHKVPAILWQQDGKQYFANMRPYSLSTCFPLAFPFLLSLLTAPGPSHVNLSQKFALCSAVGSFSRADPKAGPCNSTPRLLSTTPASPENKCFCDVASHPILASYYNFLTALT